MRKLLADILWRISETLYDWVELLDPQVYVELDYAEDFDFTDEGVDE